MDYATFGGGCFWGLEYAYRQRRGIMYSAVGFSGGHIEYPSYEDVCGGNTGHAEVVHLKFDDSQISYQELLDIFWDLHDPSSLNKQGPDEGSQYRSVIFYHNSDQKACIEENIARLNASGQYNRPVVTEVLPFSSFFKAEEYHQQYFEKNPDKRSCHLS